ncbi:hypothetical protein [Streptomyces sp. NPDC048191]|uniref:hypothetical protein n=1 Tax=Streptomyces sp. NPDC048191 TaxID=3155484 RepID=UPI00340C8970
MPTQTSPRVIGSRAGATVVLAALAAVGASWVAAPNAAAQGANGDIRVHNVVGHQAMAQDDPVVCKFYLDAVNFDILPNIPYIIQAQPPLPSAATVTGVIQLAEGAGHTDVIGLADGQYKLTWVAAGAVKEKLFRVNCHEQHEQHDRHDEGRGPGQIEDHQDHRDQDGPGWGGRDDHDDPPRGGVHAGGGGLVDTAAAYSPVAAAGAVGLSAVGGVMYLRRNRRRPHGAA